MSDEKVISSAEKLWNYLKLDHEDQPADCILVLCSIYERVAVRGAELYLQGYAPLLIFSGGLGRLTEGIFDEPEARKFAKIAMKLGVPKEAILIENQSTNTGENIRFTKELVDKNGMDPKSFIVVQHPYVERRAYATFRKIWPEKEIKVTSPQNSFEEHPNTLTTLDLIINLMVGEVQRISLYIKKDFTIHQEIPVDVWEAWKFLVTSGFMEHLMK